MTDGHGPRRSRDERSNLVMAVVLGGLALLTVVAVATAVLRPYSNAGASREDAEQTLPAPEPAEPAVSSLTTATAEDTATAPIVAAPAPAPAPKPAPAVAPKTDPEKMASLPAGTEQIIVVTGDKIGSNRGDLALYDKQAGRWAQVMKVPADFGKNGLVDGVKRRQGNMQTPTGIWEIGPFLFGLGRTAPPGTTMPYRQITESSYWSSERDGTYNSWVNHKVEGEHLIDADPQYRYAFNTGYNSLPNQRVLGRGTAIFIHCSEPPDNPLGRFTHGCIAISASDMVRLFQALDPKRNPTCAIGTLQQGGSTSIWAY